MATVCEVCYVSSEGEYLDIFQTENNIVDVISTHLQCVLLEGIDNPQICLPCWTILENFHKLYMLVEDLHRTQPDSCTSSDDEADGLAREKSSTDDPKPDILDDTDYIFDEEDQHDEQELYLDVEEMESHEAGAEISEESDDVLLETFAEDVDHPIEPGEGVEFDDDDDVDEGNMTSDTKEESRKSYKDSALQTFYGAMMCPMCEPERIAHSLPSIAFDGFNELKLHMWEVHKLRRTYLQCPLCSKRLFLHCKLWQHMDMHNNPDKYRCPSCDEIHQDLESHINDKHKGKEFECKICNKWYPSEIRLTSHAKIAHAPKDVVCEKCNKAFSKYFIKTHIRAIHGDPDYVCESCGKAYRTISMLNKHKMQHRTVAPVECPVCRQHVRANYLERHIKLMHTESPPVECESCGKSFLNKRTLLMHLNRSCPAIAYRCSTCSKSFKTTANLTEHEKTHGERAQLCYMCPVCLEKFDSKSLLYVHQQDRHNTNK